MYDRIFRLAEVEAQEGRLVIRDSEFNAGGLPPDYNKLIPCWDYITNAVDEYGASGSPGIPVRLDYAKFQKLQRIFRISRFFAIYRPV